MNDLISRQAAIDALVKWTHLTWEHLKIIYPMLNVLEKLPSAETELPFEIQDILDYLDTVLHPILSPEHWNVYSELYDMISMLPPAERHGQWKPFDLTWGRSIYACTACGDAFEVPTECGKPMYEFCPYCGAKMDLEEDK